MMFQVMASLGVQTVPIIYLCSITLNFGSRGQDGEGWGENAGRMILDLLTILSRRKGSIFRNRVHGASVNS